MEKTQELFFHIANQTLSLMPELPDLQAFSRTLSTELVGKTLKKVSVPYKKKLKTPEAALRRALHGAKLTAVYRDGKELHFAFDNGRVLALHMMLKGQLHFFQGRHDSKYPILEMLFDDGTGVVLTDWQGQATPTLDPAPRDAPDALSGKVDFRFLRTALSSSKAAVKKLLMDQSVIRGIGNAYADEILWQARISPFSVCNRIPAEAVRKLARSIRTVLIKAEKSIVKSRPGIIGGEVRDFLPIHNAKKKESPGGARIRVATTAGRKTYYTDEQKLYR